MYHALNSSKENEANLLRKCKELEASIKVDRAKIASAVALTNEQIKEADIKVKQVEDFWKEQTTLVERMKRVEEDIVRVHQEMVEVY